MNKILTKQKNVKFSVLEKYLKKFSLIKLMHIVEMGKKTKSFHVELYGISNLKDELIKLLVPAILKYYNNEMSIEDIEEQINGLCDYYIDEKEFNLLEEKDPAGIIFCYTHLLNNNVFDEIGSLMLFNKRRTMKSKPLDFYKYSSINHKKTIGNMKHDFMAFINLIEKDQRDKVRYLHLLDETYVHSQKHNKFNWLSSTNKEQASWAINYIKNNTTVTKLIKKMPNIIEEERYYHFVIPAIFHGLAISDESKELFLIKMRKAWGQVKSRNKLKRDKKTTMNIVINQSTKEQLKGIAKIQGLKMNHVIEMLIQKEWINLAEKAHPKKVKAKTNALALGGSAQYKT